MEANFEYAELSLSFSYVFIVAVLYSLAYYREEPLWFFCMGLYVARRSYVWCHKSWLEIYGYYRDEVEKQAAQERLIKRKTLLKEKCKQQTAKKRTKKLSKKKVKKEEVKKEEAKEEEKEILTMWDLQEYFIKKREAKELLEQEAAKAAKAEEAAKAKEAAKASKAEEAAKASKAEEAEKLATYFRIVVNEETEELTKKEAKVAKKSAAASQEKELQEKIVHTISNP